ncbi:MAG: glycosyltransferase family 39 protein, partial [Chloroflexi bacterium]|nr:glycosyltransferase family 39 protein [Chloroflexota bacterium]
MSLWVDEGWSAITADQDTLPAVTDMVVEDVHPPLHLYLLHIWRQLTGTSVFALRYMAVLATLLTAAFIYRLGSDLFDNQTGLIASLLYVTHDLVIVLGQEVRQYPLAMLLSVMTVWVYWRFWTETSWQRGVAFVVSGAALLWTLYWGGFVLLSLAVHAMVTQPRRVVRFASANLVIGILFLPWVPILLQQTVDDLPEGIGHALPAETNSYEILAFQLLGRPEIFWGILGIAGTFHLGRRRWWPDATTMLLASVVGITLALSIALNYFYASLSFRNLAILLPPFGLLVGHTIARFRSYERAILVLIAVAFGLTLTDAGPPTRLPWPRIANHITHHSRADDVVLIETWFDTYAFEYYLEDVESIRSQVRRRDENKAPPGFTGDEVGAAQGIWIMRFASDTDIRPALHDLGFVDSGSFQWQTPLSPVDLWRLDRPAEGLVEVFGTEIALNRYSVRRQPDGVS